MATWPGWIGDLADAALGVVRERQGAAVGMRQARQLAARISGRDSVAIGVLQIVQLAIRAEGGDETVFFAKLEAAACFGERGKIARQAFVDA